MQFFCEKNQRLLFVDFYHKKVNIIDVWHDPE